MNYENESTRIEEALQQLALLIRRHAPSNGTTQTAVPSLTLMHAAQLSEPIESVYKPSICVVAQGAKSAALADEHYRYDPLTYLVISVELPIISKILAASPEKPHLSLRLSFDSDVILDIVKETSHSTSAPSKASRGIAVSRTSPALLEALVRLMKLLDEPEDISILSPLVIREILYRVLQGEQGAQIHQFAIIGSQAHNIAQAIQQINREFARPLVIDQLAKSVNMSTSAFHKHFKRVTEMSPLQYQKTVRLQEARRLMLTETVQASDAAFRVGYESPSQFSREYARIYGRPPMLDIQAILSSITN
ncbi:AraC family transcriptional regulator [Paenibacillus radicis (ex Gao et al. 2016)]|uniref:Transcriptional regulator n=1 Tax=Paenibacillus radicis (ex Gao et al. 2016) TaxID=1737354 RepID=A0A917M0B7_9BACL|nr:AraC family transcriptional regulator [Paenibacillus radicis (ex Gao et al. 2016)]GGG69599.1 transcriptional regulator [Paenibacillus radicis (ex Gao et al. 2016)]